MTEPSKNSPSLIAYAVNELTGKKHFTKIGAAWPNAKGGFGIRLDGSPSLPKSFSCLRTSARKRRKGRSQQEAGTLDFRLPTALFPAMASDPRRDTIRRLNDEFRRTGAGGRTVVTPGLNGLPASDQVSILRARCANSTNSAPRMISTANTTSGLSGTRAKVFISRSIITTATWRAAAKTRQTLRQLAA